MFNALKNSHRGVFSRYDFGVHEARSVQISINDDSIILPGRQVARNVLAPSGARL